MKKKYLILFSFAILLLAGCTTKLDLTSYVEVDFEGYDGKGTASFEIDYEDFITDNEDIFSFDEDDLKKKSGQKFLQDVMEAISGELSEEEELSNGDKITFSWDLDVNDLEEEFKIKFVAEDITVKVKRLAEEDNLSQVDHPTLTSVPMLTLTPIPAEREGRNVFGDYYTTSDEITLTFWHFEDEKIITELAEAFMEMYPNITVEHRQMTDTDMSSELSAAIAAGTFPDVFESTHSDIALANGYWADITEYWDADPENRNVMETINEYGIGMFDTNIRFAAPMRYYPNAMFVDRNVVKYLSLNMPRTDWTWQEMIDFIKAATKYDPVMPYYGFGYYNGLSHFYEITACSKEKRDIKGEFGYTGNDFDLSYWAIGAQQFADLKISGYVAPQQYTQEMEDWSGDWDTWYGLTGHVAVMSQGFWTYQNLWGYDSGNTVENQEYYGLDIVPYKIPGATRDENQNSFSYMYMGGVSTSCEYPLEAYLLLKFMGWGIDGWKERLDVYSDNSITDESGRCFKSNLMPAPLTLDEDIWDAYKTLFPQDEDRKPYWDEYFDSITRPLPSGQSGIAGYWNFSDQYLDSIDIYDLIYKGAAKATDYVQEATRQINYYHADAMLMYFGPESVYETTVGYKNIISDKEVAEYQAIVDEFINGEEIVIEDEYMEGEENFY